MTKPDHQCQQQTSPDERLALPIEQAALLWCMRMYVVGLKRGILVDAEIGEKLDTLGLSAALPHLESFMCALSRGCTRMIEVRCICEKRLDADERALLDVLSLAQAMRPFEALLVLREFVSQAEATTALCSADLLGTALVEACRFLPEPEPDHVAMMKTAPFAFERSLTVH